MQNVTIFVCTACQHKNADTEGERQSSPGQTLFLDLSARLLHHTSIRIEAVDCLAVCDRPCTIALGGPGNWTYLIGDIDPHADLDDILLAASRLAQSHQPVLALADRPPFFRRGVLGRIPPTA